MLGASPVESKARGEHVLGNISKIVSQAVMNIKPLDSAIQQEMQAYQQDKNPDHLLKVIGMQQQIIANKGNALQGVGQIGSILEGALKGLQPNTPGPSVAPGVAQLVEKQLQNLQIPAAVPPTAEPAPGGGKEDMLRYQQAMQKQMQLLEALSKMLEAKSEMTKSIIQNFR